MLFISNKLYDFSFPHAVFEKYTTYSKHDLNKALDLELKGDIEKCLVAIGMYSINSLLKY